MKTYPMSKRPEFDLINNTDVSVVIVGQYGILCGYLDISRKDDKTLVVCFDDGFGGAFDRSWDELSAENPDGIWAYEEDVIEMIKAEKH